MDGKHTNFDLRRCNLDDDFSPDTTGASQVDSAKAARPEDEPCDRYDMSFLAERGLFSPPRSF
jgi:hypothetical protein